MSSNIIIDGQFDADTFANWTPSDSSLVSNPSDDNAYCHIEATASVMQDVSYVAGTQYVFAFYSRAANGGTVSMLDPTSGETFFTASIPSSTDWVYNQHAVTATDDWSVYVALHFQAPYNNSLDIDNVVMQEYA
ncbi:hypothetical protein D6445_11740 [Salmonella enterica subsp. enterica serovar Infantis]|nr:hypothetical protein [Salmonella enterica subsp. enterica serovar Infantis]EGI5923530.1 hypothetical protein [Salmonella enterica subsp. enterica serovar Colindale]